MKYLPLELSKKLAAKGLIPGHGWVWVETEDDGGPDIVMYDNKMEEDFITYAFDLSDIILNKDNAIKLWGGFLVGYVKNADFIPLTVSIQIHRLLDLHLLGGDVEAELLKVLD